MTTEPTVSFPDGFKALKGCPGYYWVCGGRKLYSLKSGALKKLKLQYTSKYQKHALGYDFPEYYTISVKGKRKLIPVYRIEKLLLDNYKIEINHA